MGVTNRSEIVCKKPENGSSTESLHIPHSSSESSIASTIEETAHHTNAQRRRNRYARPDFMLISNRLQLGRRKQRRCKAVRELEVLIEEDETGAFLEDGIPHHSPFIDILNDPEIGKIWDDFIQKDEDAQARLIHPENDKKIVTRENNRTLTAFEAYKNISPRIRGHLNGMLHFDELASMEEEILQFFAKTPENIYFDKDKTSYQRLLIHGVAQYYGFNSNSIHAENNERIIRVSNPTKMPVNREHSLIALIEINRQNGK